MYDLMIKSEFYRICFFFVLLGLKMERFIVGFLLLLIKICLIYIDGHIDVLFYQKIKVLRFSICNFYLSNINVRLSECTMSK